MTATKTSGKRPSDGRRQEHAGRTGLVWDRVLNANRQRSDKYRQIAAAAVELADAGGLEAVSLRVLAHRLKSGTMSLYRYVSTKDDLWDILLDAGFAAIPLAPDRNGYWQNRIVRVALETRRALLQHHWLIPLVTARPLVGPNYLAWFEYLLATCAAADPSMAIRARIVSVVWAYTSGFAAYEIGDRKTRTEHGLTERAMRDAVTPYITRLLATGKFPNVQDFLSTGPAFNADRDFAWGLRALLNGLEDCASPRRDVSPSLRANLVGRKPRVEKA